MALSQPVNQYVPVLASRAGARIRTPDCLNPLDCETFDYWRYKLATLRSKIDSDVIVSDLGINDALSEGTADGPGYAFYGRKIDWFMNLVGGERVLWTSLPCHIEPPDWQTGCKVVNYRVVPGGRPLAELDGAALGQEGIRSPGIHVPAGWRRALFRRRLRRVVRARRRRAQRPAPGAVNSEHDDDRRTPGRVGNRASARLPAGRELSRVLTFGRPALRRAGTVQPTASTQSWARSEPT